MSTQARQPITEQVLVQAYTAMTRSFGIGMTLETFNEIPKAERDATLRRISELMNRGPRFAERLAFQALNKKKLEENSFDALRKAAVAYRVGFIGYDTFCELLKEHLTEEEFTLGSIAVTPKAAPVQLAA
jgi:response regulator RpfG family c-di-GMP phosphodiesterase